MAALNGGVVINDTSGVINIDADYGQAFLSDSSSYIINNGSINLNGSPMDDTDSHMGGTPTDKILDSVSARQRRQRHQDLRHRFLHRRYAGQLRY